MRAAVLVYTAAALCGCVSQADQQAAAAQARANGGLAPSHLRLLWRAIFFAQFIVASEWAIFIQARRLVPDIGHRRYTRYPNFLGSPAIR
jgi:hypothetical protein